MWPERGTVTASSIAPILPSVQTVPWTARGAKRHVHGQSCGIGDMCKKDAFLNADPLVPRPSSEARPGDVRHR